MKKFIMTALFLACAIQSNAADGTEKSTRPSGFYAGAPNNRQVGEMASFICDKLGESRFGVELEKEQLTKVLFQGYMFGRGASMAALIFSQDTQPHNLPSQTDFAALLQQWGVVKEGEDKIVSCDWPIPQIEMGEISERAFIERFIAELKTELEDAQNDGNPMSKENPLLIKTKETLEARLGQLVSQTSLTERPQKAAPSGCCK
ncbi:hypothetical protein OAN22_00605 [Alphaproteobacteria bacterium]|nr:hypothetical protein [Alphaproteobacteria bacterium]